MSAEAHERAVQRMIQAGAKPITALTYLLELQRDWARHETYELTLRSARNMAERSVLASSIVQIWFTPKITRHTIFFAGGVE